MNLIWRFYRDQDGRWKWQHLRFDQTVLAESKTAYKEYEGCIENAREEGYEFQPSQSTQTERPPRKTRRY